MKALYISCIETHAHGRHVSSLLCKSDVSILEHSGTSGSLYLNKKNSGEQEKESIMIEKSVPRDHRFYILPSHS